MQIYKLVPLLQTLKLSTDTPGFISTLDFLQLWLYCKFFINFLAEFIHVWLQRSDSVKHVYVPFPRVLSFSGVHGNIQSTLSSFLSPVRKPEKEVKRVCVAELLAFYLWVTRAATVQPR